MEDSEAVHLINASTDSKDDEYKLYTRRWFILTLFVLVLFSCLVQIQLYVAITETVIKFYDVSISEVTWSTMVYYIEFVFLSIPSIFISENLGLRKTVLICTIGTATGAWIKVAGVAHSRFWIIILGQAFSALFSMQLAILPVKVAAKWFGAKEISRACGVGLMTFPIAFAAGFLIPTSIVQSTSSSTIERGLYILNIIFAVFPTILIPLLFLCFIDGPPTSPTKSQALIDTRKISFQDFCQSIKRCFKNRSFLCITVIYTVNNGFMYGLSDLLNPILSKYYPNSTAEIGYVGCLNNIAGVFSVIFAGYILDKFKQLKLTLWIFLILTLISTAAFLFFIDKGLPLVYVLSFLYGFFYNAVILVNVETALEVIYPEPEVTVGVFFGIGAQSIGIAFTYLYKYLWRNCSSTNTNIIFLSVIILGDASIIFINYNMKRQNAEE